MINVDTHETLRADYRRMVDSDVAKIEAKHGRDPATREQIAAHVAGRGVVCYAMGEKIRAVGIDRERASGNKAVRWSRGSFVDHMGNVEFDPNVSLTARPELVLRAIVGLVCGSIGEVVVGLRHPASCRAEYCAAEMMGGVFAATIALIEGAHRPRDDSKSIVMLAEDIAREAIDRNREVFDAIRARLMSAQMLTRREMSDILADAEFVDLRQRVAHLVPKRGGRA